MLGPDVVVAELTGLPKCQLEHFLRVGRERDVTCGRAPAAIERAGTERLLDRTAHLVQVDADAPQRVGVRIGEARLLPPGESPDIVARLVRLDPEPSEDARTH